MELNGGEALERPEGPAAVAARAGENAASLAGGARLLSEPQPGLRRPADLAHAGRLTLDAQAPEIAAACSVVEPGALAPPGDGRAAPPIGRRRRAFLASFRIRNAARAGGTLSRGLPAGPMISPTASRDAACRIIGRDGAEREITALRLVQGPQRTAPREGELLRAVRITLDRRRRRMAYRRISLSPMRRPGAPTGALMIGTWGEAGLALTPTGAAPRPVRLAFAALPAPTEAAAAADAAAAGLRFRRRNVAVPGDARVSLGAAPQDVAFGRCGPDRRLDRVERALDPEIARRAAGGSSAADPAAAWRAEEAPSGAAPVGGASAGATPPVVGGPAAGVSGERPAAGGAGEGASGDWPAGRGMAAGRIGALPPRGRRAHSRISLAGEHYLLRVGTAEVGAGTCRGSRRRRPAASTPCASCARSTPPTRDMG